MTPVTVVILAAGMGTRLGRPIPKPLTPLADGHTILERQVSGISRVWPHAHVVIVVGFKMDLVMEAHPNALFVYNDAYDRTNTARSLERALRLAPAGPVVWINGDVVFDPRVLERLDEYVNADQSMVCVNTASVGDEEIKYSLGADGLIRDLSKTVPNAVGEAIGINLVSPSDRDVFLRHLERCADDDYFERALETAIDEDSMKVTPLGIEDLFAVEVDFEEDLARANEQARTHGLP